MISTQAATATASSFVQDVLEEGAYIQVVSRRSRRARTKQMFARKSGNKQSRAEGSPLLARAAPVPNKQQAAKTVNTRRPTEESRKSPVDVPATAIQATCGAAIPLASDAKNNASPKTRTYSQAVCGSTPMAKSKLLSVLNQTIQRLQATSRKDAILLQEEDSGSDASEHGGFSVETLCSAEDTTSTSELVQELTEDASVTVKLNPKITASYLQATVQEWKAEWKETRQEKKRRNKFDDTFGDLNDRLKEDDLPFQGPEWMETFHKTVRPERFEPCLKTIPEETEEELVVPSKTVEQAAPQFVLNPAAVEFVPQQAQPSAALATQGTFPDCSSYMGMSVLTPFGIWYSPIVWMYPELGYPVFFGGSILTPEGWVLVEPGFADCHNFMYPHWLAQQTAWNYANGMNIASTLKFGHLE